MSEIGKKKRGRPVKSDSKRRRMELRLTDKDLARVYMLAEEYDISRNEVVRMALNKLFNDTKF